jgi:hypothetical protein
MISGSAMRLRITGLRLLAMKMVVYISGPGGPMSTLGSHRSVDTLVVHTEFTVSILFLLHKMSTAISLKDMHHSLSQEEGIVRQRSRSKKSPKTATSPQPTEDPWLSVPHETQASEISLESLPFAPTNTYWITPHGLLSKSIPILDLTRDISTPYTGLTPTYKDAVKGALKDHTHTPVFTAIRKTWLGLQYNITDSQGERIAEWKHPFFSTGSAVLTFPEHSPHCSHPVTLQNKTWGLRTESFVLSSISYEWEADSCWHSTNMTLYRVMGEERIVVGKYAQKWWGSFVTGGILVVDEESIDGAVAGLTLCVVLKKKRQRAAERNPGGGTAGS